MSSKHRKSRSIHLRPKTHALEKENKRTPEMDLEVPYTPSSLLNPKNVRVFGSKLCICCTKLRRALEEEGWRYRWIEVKKNTFPQLRRLFPEWKGGLPVIVIEGTWLEVPSTPDGEIGFAPWHLANPKKRRMLIL